MVERTGSLRMTLSTISANAPAARGVVQASIGITYFRSAMNSFGSHAAFVAALKHAAQGIGAEVDRLQTAREHQAG